MRLNVGCGNKILKGYVNIDKANNYTDKLPDIVADLRKLPFDDNVADELQAIHVIEHFYLWEVEDVLAEWHRVLKPGGLLVMELPALEKILYWFLTEPVENMTMWGLYGDPKYKNPDMVHKWCYTNKQISFLVKATGFDDVEVGEAQHHVPKRDMRITARKRIHQT